MGVGILAEDSAAESGEELRSSGYNRRLLGWRLGIKLLVEEVVVEVCLGGERVQSTAVVLAHLVDQGRRELGTLSKLLRVEEIDL